MTNPFVDRPDNKYVEFVYEQIKDMRVEESKKIDADGGSLKKAREAIKKIRTDYGKRYLCEKTSSGIWVLKESETLSTAKDRIVRTLKKHGTMTVSLIANRTRLSNTFVDNQLVELEEKKIVKREEHKSKKDGRKLIKWSAV